MMLPDDFENTAQSIVATNFFGNNVLQSITTKNYWDVVNEYKPLMHTWYVGLIMQFYIIVPMLLFAVGRWVKDVDKRKKVNITLMALMGMASLVRPAKLLSTVALSSVLMVQMPRVEWAKGKVFSNKWVAAIGTASFSIFVWHQVVLALIRYSFTNKLTEVLPLLAFFGITAVLSVLSYRYVEQMKKTKLAWVLTGLMLVVTTGASLYIYKNAGVVRDVPELEVVKGNVHRGMWAEYCDRVKWYDRDYPETDKTKWYVIGNSFGRDLVNIILESPIADKVEIGYSESLDNREHRLREVDVLFISTKGVTEELIEKVKSMLEDHTKLYVVGEKNFGENNTGVSPQV